MRRVHVPVARRLAAGAHAARVRTQSSAAASSSSSSPADVPTIRIRSRGYAPSRDLLCGIPAHAALNVEATLHPEDAEIQRAVLALSMPSLAEVHVTPVVPHDSYANDKVPQRSGASYGGGDVLTPTEREVMEQCLQEQLADVANLVVEQVGQRTGRQIDALQVTHTDELRNFAEIVLHSIQDELRQLRLTRSAAPGKRGAVEGDTDAAHAAPPASAAAAPLDVEAVAQVVSAKVMERLASLTAPVAAASTTTPTDAAAAATAVADLERRTTAYFEQLQARMQQAMNSGAAAHAAAPEAMELRAAVMEAVEKASATQQEHLAGLVNDWLADMERSPVGGGGSSNAAAPVDMKALEDMVESAVQTSTDELRRLFTSEMKKLGKSKKTSGSGSGSSDEDVDSSALVVEVEKVFDMVQATQSRLVAVDEVVADVFKEQASTREALQTIQELLQKQLSDVRAIPPAETAATSAAENETSSSHHDAGAKDPDAGTSTTVKAVEEAVASLQREVAAAHALASVHQAETQQQLLTVAQVVSDSVAAAVQQHTAEAVQSAMATVQQQLGFLSAAAQASAEAAAEARNAALAKATSAEESKDSTTEPAEAVPARALEPFSKEVLADAVESVLTPRWSTLSAEVERMNAANQQAIEQQLLHMANSVAASVTASLQEQLEAARTHSDGAIAAAAAASAEKTEAAAKDQAEMQKRGEAAEAAVVSAATALTEKTTQELATLRAELLSTLQTEMRKSHEVDLTPMYKYIDSVLTFMKEELNLQETNLTSKMASLADTVTAAVRDSQERPLPPAVAVASAEPNQSDDATHAAAASPAESAQVPAATATSSGEAAPPSPVTFEVPASLTNTLDLQTGALRHLEERLNELSLSQSRDMSTLLTRLQEATADFRAATSTPPSAAPLHADQLAWQSDMKTQLTSLEASLERRDADLLAAVRASAINEDVKAQLTQLESTLKSSSAAQRAEVQVALRDIVSSSAQEQTSRVDALVQRVAEMQGALRDQAVAVQLLQPSPALRGLTAEQRQVQARIRTATQEHLRHLTQIMEEMTNSEHNADASDASAAKVRAVLLDLRALQEEETALHHSAASSSAASAADPATSVESIVHAEVSKAQTAMQDSIQGLTAQHDEAQKELAATLNTLLTSVHDVGGSTSSIPSIADIQQLLDATLMRLAEEQKDAGLHVTQLVAEATRTSADALKSVVQSTLSDSVVATVEQRIIPAYHDKVEASLQTRLSEQAAAVTAAVAGVAERTTAAVGKVESLVRDFNAQRADEAQKMLAEHYSGQERLEKTPVKTRMPLWWMLANALLMCIVVLLSWYYVVACLLLAFVPKPSAEAPAGSGEAESVAEVVPDAKLRRSGRFVDEFM
ncbi:hypothetical protein ABB37_07690 [Leptomonas pyrrhocoris]|uniref:Uncharacterized protein n=1 Tax=Leptomonas pyrrhocoris TaxID=157538 RepID=A0A0M9FUH3_LEPPY|nr:hypothetical protein ABB37_07690 [Leptomonas pyrrhocoris]KPA76340.1 hypothetical protein ABB37_07690 [Leptomonas pyrrhocoris]|eukprot:XP_015654779.1 hypothetical protein ABB37_07690 [Leptomonas pyrrhocoris]